MKIKIHPLGMKTFAAAEVKPFAHFTFGYNTHRWSGRGAISVLQISVSARQDAIGSRVWQDPSAKTVSCERLCSPLHDSRPVVRKRCARVATGTDAEGGTRPRLSSGSYGAAAYLVG